jgi:hypothetical protein
LAHPRHPRTPAAYVGIDDAPDDKAAIKPAIEKVKVTKRLLWYAGGMDFLFGITAVRLTAMLVAKTADLT